jgi:hypothetical protein
VDIMNDYDNRHDGPIDNDRAPGGDSVARLIQLAGPRPLIPGDVQMRVHAAVRREWQGSYQRRRTLRWGIPFALAAAAAVATVALVRAPEIAIAPIATVVMIGCTTDGGVEMTVRDGHNRGYMMVIVRDCVGTYSEERHTAALKRIERFADVVDSNELIEIWRRE